MGWASGGDLADKIESIFKRAEDRFTVAEREQIGRELAEAFMDLDCDVLEECSGFIGDAANRITAERYGAPECPAVDDVFTDKWGEKKRFDGRRWRYVE